MPTRLVALVQVTDLHPQSRHTSGFPAEVGGETSETMPWPRVLAIVEREDGVFLDRYGEGGEIGGDTWHQSIDDAKDQAANEYAGLVSEWIEVPPGTHDDELVSFALRHDATSS